MITALILSTYLLAVMRLTRLVTRDTITEPLRIWLLKKRPLLGYWASCPWCVGLWISAAGTGFVWWHLHWHWSILVAVALSASYVTGMVAQLDQDDLEVVVEA